MSKDLSSRVIDTLKVFEFLQAGLEKGHSTSTLKVSALSAFHDCCLMDNRSLTPFEPVEESSIRNPTLHTVFLIAITSALRLGERQAISIREPSQNSGQQNHNNY
ncbi:hypothetical protein GDO81_022685 [Engystomops pustulosus]|uniref:Uncharacterized protein n=1 Tax=Engystomops pustulosus TaxID=76066 RepID=A0AAV6ZAG5_ENGPU|nr:hypothetical protein GDO81_022685 [Engystomops pustulosus]